MRKFLYLSLWLRYGKIEWSEKILFRMSSFIYLDFELEMETYGCELRLILLWPFIIWMDMMFVSNIKYFIKNLQLDYEWLGDESWDIGRAFALLSL